MSSTPEDTLQAALNPQSVAIIGASENSDKIGGARGHVTGVAGRLRVARQRPPGDWQCMCMGIGERGSEGE